MATMKAIWLDRKKTRQKFGAKYNAIIEAEMLEFSFGTA